MSDAVDNAEVMLSCITRAYKESANCRLECQYAHSVEVPMIPLVRALRRACVCSAAASTESCSLLSRPCCPFSRAPMHAAQSQMMEAGYKPTGWLGLILGCKLYFNFHPEVVETDAAFIQQVDLVERELGGRGQPAKPRSTTSRVSEGVPPGAASSQSLEPSPAPAPAPAPTPLPTPERRRGFSPSVQGDLSSPAPAAAMQMQTQQQEQEQQQQQLSAAGASLVFRMLEREDKLRNESKAEKEKLQQEMEAKTDALRQEMAQMQERYDQNLEKLREEMTPAPPAEAISHARLAALQARLEALHAAQHLTDEELHPLEDMVADYLDLKASMGVVTLEATHASENTMRLLKLVVLSEGVAADGALARHARRKFV
jgi:hypothetical protein